MITTQDTQTETQTETQTDAPTTQSEDISLMGMVADKAASDVDASIASEGETDKEPLPRPDYLLEKYVTKDRTFEEATVEQAKGYAELQKKFGGFTGAPEEYDFNALNTVGLELDSSSPVAEKFIKVAQEMNMSQPAFDKIMEVYGEDFKNNMPMGREEILSELGQEGMEDYKLVAQFASNHLTKDEVGILDSSIHQAQMVSILAKLSRAAGASNIPTQAQNNQASLNNYDTKQRVQDELTAISKQAGNDTSLYNKLIKEKNIEARLQKVM